MNFSLNRLKTIKLRQVTYPVFVFLFTVIVIVLFAYALQFLSGNLNKIFQVDDASSAPTTTLDLTSYAAVAAKLGFGNAGNLTPPATP